MKKIISLFVFLGLVVNLCSCSPSEITQDVLANTQTPTTNPSSLPRPTSTDTPPELIYLGKLRMFADRKYQEFALSYRLSPNGKWIITWARPFELGKDSIELSAVNNWNLNFTIPLNNDFLDLPIERMSEEKFNLRTGSFSSDNTSWSPDSTAFLALGEAYLGPPYTFLIIFDLTDPANVEKAIVKWKFEGMPYVAWAPDSSRLLIWFGPEIETGRMFNFNYTETAWVVDRKGNLLNEVDIQGLSSPIWVGDQLFAIKNNQEIWQIDISQNNSQNLWTSEYPIKKILDNNNENSRLLLIEGTPPYDLLIFDIQQKQIMDRIPSQIDVPEKRLDEIYGISTSSHFTGIDAAGFFIFDWSTHTVTYHGDSIVYPLWSPVVNGFIVERLQLGTLDIIYP